MTTCCTSSGAMPARSSAAPIAAAPSSAASMVDRPPPTLPIGVRAAPRVTVLGIRRETRDDQASVPATSGQIVPALGPSDSVPAVAEERKREEGKEEGEG